MLTLDLKPPSERGPNAGQYACVKLPGRFSRQFHILYRLDALRVDVALFPQPRHSRQCNFVGASWHCSAVIVTTLANASSAILRSPDDKCPAWFGRHPKTHKPRFSRFGNHNSSHIFDRRLAEESTSSSGLSAAAGNGRCSSLDHLREHKPHSFRVVHFLRHGSGFGEESRANPALKHFSHTKRSAPTPTGKLLESGGPS